MSFDGVRKFLFLFLLTAALPAPAHPQIAPDGGTAALPDSPRPHRGAAATPQSNEPEQRTQQIPIEILPGTAPRLAKYIEPNQTAAQLTAKDKLLLSGWEQVQPYAISTEVLAAAWEQLLDSDPKYGTDSAGFGERLGAAAIRQSSQAVFSDGIYAAVLHQDPRYYRKGSGTIRSRIIYSASRVVITRTDQGAEAPNFSEILGYASASALTMTYYPAVSATWSSTAGGYAVSLATSALGNQVHEFAPDLIHLLHWKRQR